MEDNFGTYLIQVARNCGTRYRCLYGGGNCGAIFHTENVTVQHLGRAELDGGHETEMLNIYNNINVVFAAAHLPATSYNEEASIGRAIYEEVASHLEGEGDDPPCISSVEKRKPSAMELTWPTGFKRSRHFKNVVEESTVVAYDMKEHVPIAEEKEEEDDVPKVPEPSKGLLEEHVPIAEEKEKDVVYTEEEDNDDFYTLMKLMRMDYRIADLVEATEKPTLAHIMRQLWEVDLSKL